MRVFENKRFRRYARREGISPADLWDAVDRADRGQIDADLGGGVIKQRIARPGAGKSGGFRTIILYQTGDRAFFVYGFAKNDLGNIGQDELDAFKAAADEILKKTDSDIRASLKTGTLSEVFR